MDDRFLYFAYGSNMLTRRLRAARRAPSAVAIGVGYVPGHRLTFDTVSTGKRQSSGTCDMEATGDATDRLYGVLFSISKTDEKSLDREEGLDRGYRKKHDRCLHRHRHQTSGRVHATQKDPTSRPYHWYKEFVVRGAEEHGGSGRLHRTHPRGAIASRPRCEKTSGERSDPRRGLVPGLSRNFPRTLSF